jgi:hypothetical protein
MKVKIYLRSVIQNGEKRLALFDTNRNGDINNLTTDVYAGDMVIWKLDCFSGIKSITKIYSKKGERNVFKTDPRKLLFCKAFKLQLAKDVKGTEAYTIEYMLCNKTKVIIDPFIKIQPPPTTGG